MLGSSVLGLELMQRLVELGELSADAAVAFAKAIHANNPKFIPLKLVNEFSAKVRAFEK